MDLSSVRIFVKVVELGSFTKAAVALKQPKSSVSRAVRRLESESGTQLLLRTTRSLRLTPAGQAFFEACAGSVRALEAARAALQDRDREAVGLVRVTASDDFGSLILSPALSELGRRHPGLTFEFNYTDELVDLVREGYDLAVRIGRLAPSRLKVTKLGEVTLLPVAAPAYLARAPRLREPHDLLEPAGIVFGSQTTAIRWMLSSPGSKTQVPVPARYVGNHMRSLANLAREGAGIALLPNFLCREDIRTGRLQRVLPQWTGPRMAVSLLASATGTPHRVQLVKEHLIRAVRAALGRA